MPRSQTKTKAEGALIGSAVGDALGWPMEDRSGRVGGRRGVEPSLQFTPWRRREGGKYQPHEEDISAGSYSDDTQLTLAVARSLMYGTDWWRWLTHQELPFWLLYERGGGGATKRAATAWSRSTAPWSDKNRTRYFDAGGNGVAMRIAPHCVVREASTFDHVARSVIADAVATHGHPRAIVGAVLHAYSVWRCLAQDGVLGYGQLIDDVLLADEWRSFYPPDTHIEHWEEHASRHFGRPYRDVWNEVVGEVIGLLETCRTGIGQGSLAIDRPVLDAIGCFGSASGAGTVSAVGALFLASRYASQPQGGLVAAAFAKGADTDTLAAMTGTILGAIHEYEWLTVVSKQLQDVDYIRGLSAQLVSHERRQLEKSVLEPRPVTARAFWPHFGEPQKGEPLALPDGRRGTVTGVVEHATKRRELVPRTWVVLTEDGQTLHFKRVQKAQPTGPPTADTARAPASDVGDRRPRIGVVLHVADLERARVFYRDVVGLDVSKSSPTRTVFAGLLALEPLPSSLRLAGTSEQLALLENDPTGPAPTFDALSAITIYLGADDFGTVRTRIERAERPLSEVVLSDGRETFRCLDPDGNVIEFRSRNGG